MNIVTYLTDPTCAPMFLPAFVAAPALAILCGLLTSLVVLKRMAFIGQGVSHAAFGGIGVWAILVFTLGGAASGIGSGVASDTGRFVIVAVFCVAAALGIGLLSERRTRGGHGGVPASTRANTTSAESESSSSRRGTTVGGVGLEADTAIGIILVAAMALGAVLIKASHTTQSWESFLFGSIWSIGWADAILAWATTLATGVTLLIARRPLIFWAYDESGARAFGISTRGVRATLMVLLAIATVVAMKLAGVVLATALLVVPGAAAIAASRRLARVMTLGVVFAIVGVMGGLVVSVETDLLPGPSIVGVLLVLLVIPAMARAINSRRTNHA
ncbi:MAG: metal ABC transporter permease [Phycisphaerales bacterium]|nr:MAG: metal ABC transporter permease [Phycisphaerales bacterium]